MDMSYKIIKSSKKFLDNTNGNIFSIINMLFKSFNVLSIINMIITNFLSSSSSGVIRSWSSKAEEIVKSLFLEEMSISGEFVEWTHIFDFSKVNWHSSSLPISQILF